MIVIQSIMFLFFLFANRSPWKILLLGIKCENNQNKGNQVDSWECTSIRVDEIYDKYRINSITVIKYL